MMSPIRYEMSIPFDGRIAGDIAITAAEGVTGDWAVINRYHWSRWNGINVGYGYVFYTVVADTDGNQLDMPVTIDSIRRGIYLYLNGVPGNFQGRPFDDMSDLSVMDAEEADAVIQLGIFGTLIYG